MSASSITPERLPSLARETLDEPDALGMTSGLYHSPDARVVIERLVQHRRFPQPRRHSIHLYEPIDLDDLEPHAALDAVIADVHECRITGDSNGLFTASRNVSLLCYLSAPMAADAEYALASKQPSTKASPSAATLGQTSGYLGQAIAHYTQALTPLVTLTTHGTQDTLQKQLDAIEDHSRLRLHLHDGAEALTATRACLHATSRPTATTTSIPPHTPSTGTHPRPHA